jgi:hypothetical protein
MAAHWRIRIRDRLLPLRGNFAGTYMRTLTPETSLDMAKYSPQRRVEFMNLRKAALLHS